MGFHLGFYFILLFLLCPMAAESQETICGEEICGNVTIPSPFGIHGSCYTRSWFRVICKQTHNGKRPFISINGIDIEVLGSLFSGNSILIKNPVTYVNRDHKMDDTVSLNLTGTPFFFSSDYNLFGSVGCGNLATVFSNDGEPLGGCIQPRCGGDGASEPEPGCFNKVFGNLSSSMVNMTAMYPGGKDESTRCASAFFFSRLYFHGDDPLAIGNGINIETTHVPTTLSWNSTYCGPAGCEPGPGLTSIYSENSCGNVTFQFPFEINDQHHLNHSWFTIICKKTTKGLSVPFININGIDLHILDFSFLLGNVVVNHSITYFNCRKTITTG
ncbi:wall-associated receptor kinase-like 22 [Hibiscus syriacus]|uniref:wall-associated receptor kinase-like 22 n=1 Tax=Hibiscus syriacus TaxID=106335 RepID=UPI0019250E0B|nr:wall-associated receptor kinase-like 22 [Hibiscus syriacus]